MVAVIRKWSKENEPIFRLIEVLFVVVAGSVFAAWVGLKQEQIAEKSLEVSESQLRVAELQTQLARAEYAPNFVFDHTDHPQVPSLGARTTSGHVRYLDGVAKLFVEYRPQSRRPKHILVDGFFEDPMRPQDDGRINFYHPPGFDLFLAAGLAFR
ncbi:MAG: hypothetical protein HY000_10820 [Planctomycetes bacterium]|nr:hypothetical protein [Planctomycetota bacterium]